MIAEIINDYFIMVIFGCLFLHIVVGIFLNKLYYTKENKNTPMAFIPFANIYLIGSLALHPFVGWILVITTCLNINFPIIVENKVIIKRILPENVNNTISLVIFCTIILLLVILLFKKKSKNNIQINSNQFLTETELMKDPTTLKRNAQLNHNNNLEKKDSNPSLETKLDSLKQQQNLNIPQPRTNNNIQMPKQFSNFNSPNQLNHNSNPFNKNNNPFNRRGL